MRIGYPCINRTIENGSAKTFRLKSFTSERFHETVKYNLNSLLNILKWNREHGFFIFRISSQLIPFASHPICTINWQQAYREKFEEIGEFITSSNMRVSFHPDQFTLLNSPSESIFENAVRELDYHASVFDTMKLSTEHKIQIHVGGMYGDKEASTNRFIKRFKQLPAHVQHRLSIENDDRLYSLRDCLFIHEKTRIPIIFDTFHHALLNNNEPPETALLLAQSTWKKTDGPLMVDYSSQEEGKRIGTHATTLDTNDFGSLLPLFKNSNVDVMLEIKDKEKSGMTALGLV